MTYRQDLADMMPGEMLELMASVRHYYGKQPDQVHLYCRYDDCGVAYVPVSLDDLGGMFWSCPGCGRLTNAKEKRRPDPDDC